MKNHYHTEQDKSIAILNAYMTLKEQDLKLQQNTTKKERNCLMTNFLKAQFSMKVITDKWMDSAEVFSYLHISKRTLQNWRDSGVIPYYFVKGKVWYKKSEIDALLEGSKVQNVSEKRINRSCLATKK